MITRTLTILAAALALTFQPASAAERPNIILILADDLGWADTTLYGKTSLYETPNLERLAARGMTFTHAYSSHPLCSPTRSSILSGQNPARTGFTTPAGHIADVRYQPAVKTNGRPDQKSSSLISSTRLNPSMPTLAAVLKDAGYATAHFGKWHLGTSPHSALEFGFDVDIPNWNGPGPGRTYLAPWSIPGIEPNEPGEHIEDRMAKEAVNWLKNRDQTKPFFMNYWQFSVHAPFGAKPELIDRYRKKIDRNSAQQCPTYAAMLESMDDAIGTLLDALDAEGIADETIIIFTSDNGGNIHCGLEETDTNGETYITPITSNAPLRGGKGGIHEGGIRVPGVVVWPGVTRAGSSNDTRIQSVDLYPTILNLSGVDHPANHIIDGVDFTAALKGEAIEREPMFTYVPSYGNTPQWLPPSMAVHHGDWKLIRTFHHGENGAHQFRLYNLQDDIGENKNLASTHPEKVEAMDSLIENYINEAKVLVPLPNSKFDPAQFDPSKIGVQSGGLKMPPSKAKPAKPAPLKTTRTNNMLGWAVKGGDVSVADGALKVTPNKGRKPLLVNSKLRVKGAAELTIRLRAKSNGSATAQWRTEEQALFPETGQRQAFSIKGGDWQELRVPLPVEGKLVQLRLVIPAGKHPVEIDWIEITPTSGNEEDRQRWDFDT